MENQVVSLELAIKLKELGVKQDSVWCWVYSFPTTYIIGLCTSKGCLINHTIEASGNLAGMQVITGGDPISAFTVAELGELLPEAFTDNSAGHLPHVNKADGFWQIDYPPNGRVFEQTETEADARAMMLIWLVEQGDD